MKIRNGYKWFEENELSVEDLSPIENAFLESGKVYLSDREGRIHILEDASEDYGSKYRLVMEGDHPMETIGRESWEDYQFVNGMIPHGTVTHFNDLTADRLYGYLDTVGYNRLTLSHSEMFTQHEYDDMGMRQEFRVDEAGGRFMESADDYSDAYYHDHLKEFTDSVRKFCAENCAGADEFRLTLAWSNENHNAPEVYLESRYEDGVSWSKPISLVADGIVSRDCVDLSLLGEEFEKHISKQYEYLIDMEREAIKEYPEEYSGKSIPTAEINDAQEDIQQTAVDTIESSLKTPAGSDIIMPGKKS